MMSPSGVVSETHIHMLDSGAAPDTSDSVGSRSGEREERQIETIFAVDAITHRARCHRRDVRKAVHALLPTLSKNVAAALQKGGEKRRARSAALTVELIKR